MMTSANRLSLLFGSCLLAACSRQIPEDPRFAESAQVEWVSSEDTSRDIAEIASRGEVRQAQLHLKRLGYLEIGTADGILDGRTRKAIVRFQRDHEIAGNGRFTEETLERLDSQSNAIAE